MKRSLLVLLLVVLLAAALAFFVQQRRKPGVSVASLVPAETMVFLHLPELERTMQDWHASDAYQLWSEPSVQAFLRRPAGGSTTVSSARDWLRELERFEPKDLFFAVTALEADHTKFAAGFRFNGKAQDLEALSARWQREFVQLHPAARQERVDDRGHSIQTLILAQLAISTTTTRGWWLASNDAAELRSLIERVEGGSTPPKPMLAQSATYLAATSHLLAPYGLMGYAQPAVLGEKLPRILATMGRNALADQVAQLAGISSFAGGFAFDHGKMREVTFLAKSPGTPALERTSLKLAPADSFLYWASQWSANEGGKSSPALGLARVQQFLATLAEEGITPEDRRAAFGTELGVIGSWPAEARWPAALLSLPVNDRAKALRLGRALAVKALPGVAWNEEEQGGVTYLTAARIGGFIPVNPTIAISDRVLLAGLDRASVDAALTRANSATSELAKTERFSTAANAVAPATTALAYLDTRLLFERLDTVLRPVLFMGAAFFPGVNQSVDLAHLPPPEAVVKHLSPMILSQHEVPGGIVTESLGPITFDQAALAMIGVAVMRAIDSGDALFSTEPSASSPAPIDP